MGGGASSASRRGESVKNAQPLQLVPVNVPGSVPPAAAASSKKGGGIFQSMKDAFISKKAEAPPPLTTAVEVMANEEALARIKATLEFAPPGTVFRWDKLLTAANRVEPQTDPKVFPLQLKLEMDEYKACLQKIFDSVTSVNSDGIALMREYIPKMYDKHSVERGRRVSQKEREELNLCDECYAYGEMDIDIFASIYMKVTTAYGLYPQGIFYDLGSGVGNLVYAAALIGSFNKCCGIEGVKALHDRANLRAYRWNSLKENFPRRFRDIDIVFSHDNFFKCDFQTEATFVLLHWTAFTRAQRETVAETLESCREGTLVVALTHPIPGETFEILKIDECDTSWGHTIFYVQEKLTAGRNRL
jgi:hypothetical protein